MNARRILLITLASAVAAMAQTAPPSQRVAPNTARTQVSPMAPRKAAKAKPAAAAHAKAPATQVAAGAIKPAGKRDPFVSPVRDSGPAGPNCTVGKKCLAINAIALRGIAATPSGQIAVVVNQRSNMTYFLRENDPVFNGFVVKITPDSIVFRENVMDRLGKQGTRDIVMKVSAPAV